MTELNPTPQVRTVAIAVAEIRYGIEYGSVNEVFWRKLDTMASVCQAVAGSLAFAGAFSPSGDLFKFAGAAIAVVSATQLVVKPMERAFAFRDARIKFHDLAKRAWDMPLRAIDAELEDLRAHAPRGSTLLAPIALNRVNRQMGHPADAPMGWANRLAQLLV